MVQRRRKNWRKLWLHGTSEFARGMARWAIRSAHAPINHPLYTNGDSIGCIEYNVINIGLKDGVFGTTWVVEI